MRRGDVAEMFRALRPEYERYLKIGLWMHKTGQFVFGRIKAHVEEPSSVRCSAEAGVKSVAVPSRVDPVAEP